MDKRQIELRAEKLLAIVEQIKDDMTPYLGHEDWAEKGLEALEGGLMSITANAERFKKETAAFNDMLFSYSDWTEEEEAELK